jgi:hypothetical protein
MGKFIDALPILTIFMKLFLEDFSFFLGEYGYLADCCIFLFV